MNAPLKLAPELELLGKLEESQWWSPARIEGAQWKRLAAVLRHARATVPFYRERLAALDARGPLSSERWQSLPLLTRRDIQEAGGALLSERVPDHCGSRYTTQSSGSTGEPVSITGTALNQAYWRALTLRDHQWHKRDLVGTLCAIRPVRRDRAGLDEGVARGGWGPATDALGGTGKMALLSLATDIGAQAEWLARHDPDYLISFPSNVLALAEHFAARGLRLPRLREVRTVGETLAPAVIERVRAAWNVPVTDLYSSEEVGVIALQCASGSGLYHVQSESVMVEVLDDAGRPCAPWTIGRVVVSSLHNFAMPLLRYELGDYAEAGASCPCGRGLPTLARILGRQRNMLVLPSGEKRWPLSGFSEYRDIAPIRRYQIVQLDRGCIEMRFVAERPVSADEEQRLTEVIRRWLGHPFEIRFRYFDELPRSASGKFEEFISMVDQS